LDPGDFVQAVCDIDYRPMTNVKRGDWGVVIESSPDLIIKWLKRRRLAVVADLDSESVEVRQKGPPIGPPRWKIWTGIATAICAIAFVFVLPSPYEIWPHSPQELLNMVQRYGPRFVENLIEEDGVPCVVIYERLGPHHARVVLRRRVEPDQVQLEQERLNQRL
jgi:hypothetical protein